MSIKKIVHITDAHRKAGEEDYPAWLLAKKFIKSFQPDIIVNHGDHLDVEYLGKFSADDEEMRWNRLLKDDYDLLKRDFDFLQKNSKQVIYALGNHEDRIDKFIRKYPVLRGFMDLETQFEGTDIILQRSEDGPYRLGKLACIHGWYFNIHHAKKHVEEWGGDIAYGHTHQLQTYTRRLPAQDLETTGYCIPCLTWRDPAYRKGVPTKHVTGLGVNYMKEDGSFNLTQYKFDSTNWSFIFEGKEFKL